MSDADEFDWIAADRQVRSAVLPPWVPSSVPDDGRPATWARLVDYWAGGSHHRPRDRELGQYAETHAPMAALTLQRLALRERVVRFAVTARGIDQILVAGADLPVPPEVATEVHVAAQVLNPRARVVYASAEPGVVEAAREKLTSGPHGACGYVPAGPQDPVGMLFAADRILDLHRPVLVLLNHLDLLPAEAASYAVAMVSQLVAAGSLVAVCNLASDLDPALIDVAAELARSLPAEHPFPRPWQGTVAWLSAPRMTLVHPGVVLPARWSPTGLLDPDPDQVEGMWCGVADIGAGATGAHDWGRS